MNTLKYSNILVTGGTGFIGSHLVESLCHQGINIVTSFLTLSPHAYFSTQKLHDHVKMVHVDITDFDSLFDVITKHNIDYIFHLAAQPIVEVAFYNPRRTLSSNILGTVNVLESARLYPKIKGVIVASSDKAYGKQGKEKYKETDILKGDHPYEVSKSAADLIAHAYFKTYNLSVVTARFGNVYGEGDLNFSRIIPGIMKSVVKGESLELRSDGTFVRDYVYVKDVVAGYLLLAENIQKVKGEAFNFGSKETRSVLEVITAVEEVLQKKVPYKILNTAKNEIPYQSLDYSKIIKTLKWNTENSFQTRIHSIYAWYKSIL